ncbi:MAG TPA: hypothetical protein PK854_04675 [Oscillospiraceae bacterium]|nr:hypothetical protein [Oscillospiraceae bacterium]HPS34541.1 hypothetical protein [Oscillospiraceae bacterium]
MITCKRIVSWVLAAVALAVISGCVKLTLSAPEKSMGSLVSLNSSERFLSAESTPAVQDLLEKDIESGFKVIELSRFFQGLSVKDIRFLNNRLIGIIAYDSNLNKLEGESQNNHYLLAVFSVDTLQLLYEKRFTLPQGGYMGFYRRGDPVALYSLSPPDIETFYTVTENGITQLPKEEFFRFRLSDTSFVLEKGNDLVLEQNGAAKTILTGVSDKTPDGEAPTWEKYTFECRLSDTRFLFIKSDAYEQLIEFGVYDIETGEITLLTPENSKFINLHTSYDNKAVLVSYDKSLHPAYLYDDITGKMAQLKWMNDLQANGVFPHYCLFKNTLIAFVANNGTAALRFFDLASETEKTVIELPSSYRISKNYPSDFFITESDLWFYSLTPNGYIFRIPIEEVTKK